MRYPLTTLEDFAGLDAVGAAAVAYTPDLDELLRIGARFVRGDTTYVVEMHRLDVVVLPAGQVVGCDPLVFTDSAAPFTVAVAPGTYPLRAWVVLLHRGDDVLQRGSPRFNCWSVTNR